MADCLHLKLLKIANMSLNGEPPNTPENGVFECQECRDMLIASLRPYRIKAVFGIPPKEEKQ